MECNDNTVEPERVSLQMAGISDGMMHDMCLLISGLPLAPLNLHATLTSTTSVAVRLSWDPPLNDGGAIIAN